MVAMTSGELGQAVARFESVDLDQDAHRTAHGCGMTLEGDAGHIPRRPRIR